ncbi:MAG: protein phosphatase 2C domain-containing protein [Nocardioidaceae bacterium]
MAFSLRFSAVSDIGRRKKNDDSGYAGPHFVMVADGMGGAPHGDLASSVAVQTMQRLDSDVPDDMLEALAGAVHRANDRLAELIEEDAATEGMGTTVTAALFDGTRIGVVHLGDSRGYLWRDGELLRISQDHSWVQSLIDEGRISEEEAAVHSHRSLLLKVLDGRHDNDPDLNMYDVQAGDRILLCSDGLSGFVDHERLERVMSIGSADAVANELVQLALESNSNDNITVVVADVVEEPSTDAQPLIVGAAAAPPRGYRNRLRGWGHRPSAPGETVVDPGVDPETLRYAPGSRRAYASSADSSRSSWWPSCSVCWARPDTGGRRISTTSRRPTGRSRSSEGSRPTFRGSRCTTSTRRSTCRSTSCPPSGAVRCSTVSLPTTSTTRARSLGRWRRWPAPVPPRPTTRRVRRRARRRTRQRRRAGDRSRRAAARRAP